MYVPYKQGGRGLYRVVSLNEVLCSLDPFLSKEWIISKILMSQNILSSTIKIICHTDQQVEQHQWSTDSFSPGSGNHYQLDVTINEISDPCRKFPESWYYIFLNNKIIATKWSDNMDARNVDNVSTYWNQIQKVSISYLAIG